MKQRRIRKFGVRRGRLFERGKFVEGRNRRIGLSVPVISVAIETTELRAVEGNVRDCLSASRSEQREHHTPNVIDT